MGNEIREGWSQLNGEFVMRLSRASFEADLSGYVFDDRKIDIIKEAIIHVNMDGEFRTMTHASLRITDEPDTLSATGTVGGPTDGHDV
jgi:hypothetical protein